MRRLTAALWLAAAVALSALVTPAPAHAERCPDDRVCGIELRSGEVSSAAAPDIDTRSGLLVTDAGRVLWSREADTRRAMASTTKLMTALVVLDNADLSETVTISRAAAGTPYATGLKAGERRTVRELLELALVTSSNDACIALAEHVGGSVGGFATLMNERAAAMGLSDSHFVNPHGLDATGHYSSAADLAAMAREAMRNEEFARIVHLRTVTLPAHGDRAARTIKSTDKLLKTYPGLLGGKTGFTNDAKYSFVSVAHREGLTLTAVILGAPSSATRFKHAARLLDWGFEHTTVARAIAATETVGLASIDGSGTVALRVPAAVDATVLDLAGPLSTEVSVTPGARLPVFAGQQLGVARVVQAGQVVASSTVQAATDVAAVEETMGAVPVSDYLDRVVALRVAPDGVEVAEHDPALAVKRVVDVPAAVSAPLAANEQVGEIRYTQGSTVVARVPVVAAASVEAPGLIERVGIWFGKSWRALTGRPTVAAATSP